jgi:chromosome segregation ATPase
MDVTVWTDIIRSLGLPIALIIAMGLFIYKLWQQSAEREKTLYKELESGRKVNEKAIETIAQYAEKLGDIQSDVKSIKEDITVISAFIERK